VLQSLAWLQHLLNIFLITLALQLPQQCPGGQEAQPIARQVRAAASSTLHVQSARLSAPDRLDAATVRSLYPSRSTQVQRTSGHTQPQESSLGSPSTNDSTRPLLAGRTVGALLERNLPEASEGSRKFELPAWARPDHTPLRPRRIGLSKHTAGQSSSHCAAVQRRHCPASQGLKDTETTDASQPKRSLRARLMSFLGCELPSKHIAPSATAGATQTKGDKEELCLEPPRCKRVRLTEAADPSNAPSDLTSRILDPPMCEDHSLLDRSGGCAVERSAMLVASASPGNVNAVDGRPVSVILTNSETQQTLGSVGSARPLLSMLFSNLPSEIVPGSEGLTSSELCGRKGGCIEQAKASNEAVALTNHSEGAQQAQLFHPFHAHAGV
jgi:hypothetical protein